MTLLAVWGAVASFLTATADGLAILPRPGLPLVGEASPIAALPMAALLTLEAAVLLGLLQNGFQAITLDEWKRLEDHDNYEIIYDYDYGQPYRKLVYFPASAPDDSDAYFDSEEHEGGGEEHGGEGEEEHGEGGGEGHRRASQPVPYSQYQRTSYNQGYRPAYPAPAPSYGQGSYPSPHDLAYHRYKREIQDLGLDTELKEIKKTVEELALEDDQEILEEEVKELSGQVLKLDRDNCLLKLLCHLQKKPKEARDPQDAVVLNVFKGSVAQEDLTCSQEYPQCPVEEKQLVEAFSYMWQLQNTA